LADRTPILVADDDPVTLRMLQVVLEGWNFEVIPARDGLEALSLIRERDVSIALLDWAMPKMNGVEVCRRMREAGGEHYVYIVLLTARDSKDDLVTAMNAGADDFINKPFHTEELHSRIKAGVRIIELENRLAKEVKRLQQALEEVSQLKRLIPICMYCKKVRNDDDYWQDLENYIHEHTGADFSHSVCPTCMENIVKPELVRLKKKNESD